VQLKSGDSQLHVREGVINILALSKNVVSVSSFVGMSVG